MNQELMTLDFWQDTVIYESKTFPVGTLACDALNVPVNTIAKINEQCEKINLLLGILNAGQDASALCPIAKEAALTMLDILSQTPPFSYMNISKHRERIEKVFTVDNALKYVEFAIKAATNSLQFEEIQNFTDAMMLQRYTAVFGHLAYSLGEYQTAMLDFAEKTDGNEADRTAEGFAKMFGSYFPPEFSITEGNAWMSTLNNSVQYVSKEYKRVTATMQCSYSKKAYPWDNACIESFHSLIKREWLNRFKIRDYEHAYRLIFEYLEAFYNTKRIHSHCDYMSPNDYEELYRRLQQDELQLAG